MIYCLSKSLEKDKLPNDYKKATTVIKKGDRTSSMI